MTFCRLLLHIFITVHSTIPVVTMTTTPHLTLFVLATMCSAALPTYHEYYVYTLLVLYSIVV